MLRSDLCDYADSYILVKETITITGAGNDDAARQADERDKCYPFTKCITRIKNTDIDNAHDIDIAEVKELVIWILNIASSFNKF